jgi:intracellular multiplication protein IcmF
MLGDKSNAKSSEIIDWFTKNWEEKYSKKQTHKKLALISKVLNSQKPLKINQQILNDTRNYLNSLPSTYLFYTLAKGDFAKNNKKIEYQGFVIGNDKIPEYLTKNEFVKIINKIPSIVKKFHDENWILAREDLQELPNLLQQAYCYEYVIFWQNFINKSHPIHAQTFNDIHTLTKILRESNIIKNVISTTQNATSPITDNSDLATLFNQEIASKFSDINLIGESSIQNLILTLNELERYVSTLAIVNDNGKTSYNLARTRFKNDDIANPISSLFNQAKQFPKPISSWTEQIAEDVWYAIINDCRTYINYLWKQQILPEYQSKIANRFPFTNSETDEISIYDFNSFFAKNGVLNTFVNEYLKPFLDTDKAEWQPKELNHYMLPINKESIHELIRANVITNMFFANTTDKSRVDFSLEKINLDPNVNSLELKIGKIKMHNSRDIDDDETKFTWPETNANLVLNSIDGHKYELEELGPWAFFKILQKLNVLVNEEDSSQLQILFEINGNAGRYTLKAKNQVNPFIPGILNEFHLPETIA